MINLSEKPGTAQSVPYYSSIQYGEQHIAKTGLRGSINGAARKVGSAIKTAWSGETRNAGGADTNSEVMTMTGVPFRIRVLGVLVLLIGLTTPPVAAQDVDAMAKWTAYTVVHYKVVGEYSGQAPILVAKSLNRQVQVTDRVEFELDWNQQEFKLVGTPVIRNSPSKLGAIAPVPNCPPPRVEGPFELMTLQAIKADGPMSMSGVVTLEAKRDQPAGAIPTMNERGCQEWIAVKAKSEADLINFQLPPAMSLAMPGGAPYTLSPDGKSLIVKTDGWVWTCTPTGVK